MASTITLTGDWLTSEGNRSRTHGTGNLGTYAASGVAVTPNQLGLGLIDDMQIQSVDGYVFEFDKDNSTIWAYEAGADGAPLDEVGVTDISASVFRWTAIGR